MIGNLGDAWASIHVEGATAIGSGHCIASIHGNTMVQCGQGRAASVRGISIMPYDLTSYVAHPAASNKSATPTRRAGAATPAGPTDSSFIIRQRLLIRIRSVTLLLIRGIVRVIVASRTG